MFFVVVVVVVAFVLFVQEPVACCHDNRACLSPLCLVPLEGIKHTKQMAHVQILCLFFFFFF